MSDETAVARESMHSEAWWLRALEGDLTPDEQRAWEGHLALCQPCHAEWSALMELDALFAAAPTPTPPAGFMTATLARLERTRRYRRWAASLGGLILILVVAGLELLAFGALFSDLGRMAAVLGASHNILWQMFLQISVSLITFFQNIMPCALILSALYLSFLMPNGLLATLTVIFVRQRRPLPG